MVARRPEACLSGRQAGAAGRSQRTVKEGRADVAQRERWPPPHGQRRHAAFEPSQEEPGSLRRRLALRLRGKIVQVVILDRSIIKHGGSTTRGERSVLLGR